MIAGTLVVSNRKKADIVAEMHKKGYTFHPNIHNRTKEKPSCRETFPHTTRGDQPSLTGSDLYPPSTNTFLLRGDSIQVLEGS